MPADAGREREAVELTRFLVHKHYCENDFTADESLFDDPFAWLGAGEEEFLVGGKDELLAVFRQFKGKVPRCNITGEEYRTMMPAGDVCLCVGRMWIATDPSTGVYLRVHQRITTCIRWQDGKARCCHLHISNPYTEMQAGDVGFPTEMAQQSRDYMRQQIEIQKAQIAAASEELASIYHTVSCGIVRLLRQPGGEYRLLTCNRAVAKQLGIPEEEIYQMDWGRGFTGNIVEEDAPLLQQALDGLRAPGQRASVDYRVRARSGQVLYMNCSIALISSNDAGDIIQRLTYDITRRVELENELKRLSFTDTLTGLYNRNRFNTDVAEIQRHPERPLGVACFDLNGLKAWNDQMGHMAGDMLIRRTADCIAGAFPHRAYRIGGDEFAVLWPGAEEEAFHLAAQDARARLALAGISISMGVCWRPTNCDAWRQYDEADRLMYQEKQVFYRATGQHRQRER